MRIEQLYPFPEDISRGSSRATAAIRERVWVQEEPRNRGAWLFMRERFGRDFPGVPLAYIGREESASPATGSHQRHEREQQEIVQAALDTAERPGQPPQPRLATSGQWARKGRIEARGRRKGAQPSPEEREVKLEIRIPSVGESVTQGIISSWLKADGRRVEEGGDLLELETDKATVTVPRPPRAPSPSACAAGTEVAIGQVSAPSTRRPSQRPRRKAGTGRCGHRRSAAPANRAGTSLPRDPRPPAKPAVRPAPARRRPCLPSAPPRQPAPAKLPPVPAPSFAAG